MTEDRKTLLTETTELLKDLDRKSLELIRTGAELLRARDALEQEKRLAGQPLRPARPDRRGLRCNK